MLKPKVILFSGVSLDGRIDFGSGEVDMGLYYELASSWKADAMLSGSNTILSMGIPGNLEEPESVTPPVEYNPLAVPRLVVVDSRGRVHYWNFLRSQPFWHEVTVLCSHATPEEYLEYLDRSGVAYIIAGDDHIDFHLALEELNTRYGVKSVRVDSGGILNGVLLRAGLVDEVSILIDPCTVGGTSPKTWYVAPDLTSPDGIQRLELIQCEKVRENILWLRYRLV